MRVTSDYANLNSILSSIGSTFGATGVASLAARERLIDLAGGINELASKTKSFGDNYLTEAERLAPVQAYVTEQLAAMGLAGITSRDQFKAVVLGIDKTTEAGAKQFVAMMDLADAFAQVHPAIDATATSLQAMKDAATGLLGNVDSAFSVLQNVVGREKAIIQSRIDAETAAITKIKGLSDALHSTLDSMHMPGQAAYDRAAAQAQIKTALTIAKAGGPLPDADKLKQALGAVTQDASSQFATYQDYQRDFYSTQNDIAGLAKYSDDALSVEQKTLDALNAQSKQLDGVLSDAQAQIDALKGIDTTGLTIVQALEGIRVAILAAQANPIVGATGAINQAYQSALGRAPDAGGLDFWQHQAANGTPVGDIVGAIKNSPEAQVQNLYHSLLGRGADAGGLDFFLHSGASMDEIKNDILGSDEYKHPHNVPGFAVGINRVPFDMTARIHADEAVVPAAFNPFNPGARISGSGGDNSALEAAVDRLAAASERQQDALDRIAREVKRQADGLEVVTDGFNAMRTKEEVPA
jgi:hypothetical protein